MSTWRKAGTIVAATIIVAAAVWALERGRIGAILIALVVIGVLIAPCWGLFTKREQSRAAKLLGLGGEDARDLGSSLLTGLVVAAAVMVLQIYLDFARERDAREEQLRLSIGVSQSLAGLDAHDSDLSELSLAGKNLDRADLSGANLSGANLEAASLREADLRGADLDGASLYGAKLPRAKLSGADLDGADLRFAKLGDAEIYARDGYEQASFEGARVNSRTCLPADIVTGLGEVNSQIREELQPTETEVHGRVRADVSLGYQCPLTADNVIDDLQQYPSGRTYAQLADPWRVEVDQVAAIFETGGATDLKREHLRLTKPVCPGTVEVHVHRSAQWAQGSYALLVRYPGEPVENTRAVPIDNEEQGLKSPVDLPDPLRRGMRLIRFAIPSTTQQGLDSKFIDVQRVNPCRHPAERRLRRPKPSGRAR